MKWTTVPLKILIELTNPNQINQEKKEERNELPTSGM